MKYVINFLCMLFFAWGLCLSAISNSPLMFILTGIINALVSIAVENHYDKRRNRH